MTAAQLAKQLNLSRTTVSAVLNGRAEKYGLAETTVNKVLAGARRFNYRPDPVARQLVGMRSNFVGILANTSKLVDPRLVERLEVWAAEKQLRVIVGFATTDAERVKEYLADFRGRRVDAIISLSHNHAAYRGEVLDELQKFPQVLFYEKPAARVVKPWYVQLDYYEMGRLAAQHLIDRGCRRIGLMGLSERLFPLLRERRRGFEDALRQAGLPHGGPLVWHVDEEKSARWIEPPTEEEAADVVEGLVVRQKCDGIFAINDLFVARLAGALNQIGRRVPDDVALVGADNMDISTLVEPKITTIDVQIDTLARSTIDLLVEMLQENEARSKAGVPSPAPVCGRGISVKPKLVVRRSA